TANLENQLDSVAEGELEWIPLLDEFWRGFNQQILDKTNIARAEITQEAIGENCPKCGKPLNSRLGKRGKFIGCSGFPECDYTRNMNGDATATNEPVIIGAEPESGKDILLMNGPYGPYLQLGQAEADAKKKPKRVSIPKDIPLASVNLDIALMLMALPRDLGLHPETNKKVIANIGRFGPYVNHDGKFKSIPRSDNVFDIDLARAVELLAQANTGPAPIRELGSHPTESGAIAVYAGRYGPYVQHGKLRATLQKSQEPETVTLEEAVELLAIKAAKELPGKKPTSAKKKSAAKKKAAGSKKNTGKKTAKKAAK
ncbi:MAG TPA: topoisomerase C-terminal repeat-containing protein, partial [Methylophilaceae bacterium]|nr:topoisomerase C-terminal repeat-containing protein [Methylophilaceae bacterium]